MAVLMRGRLILVDTPIRFRACRERLKTIIVEKALEHKPNMVPSVVLVVLDGWGIGRNEPGNAVLAAQTPVMDYLSQTYPCTTLKTSGEAVGLPDGQMGNSEVGHLNIGAGFVVYQWITRIDLGIADGSFFQNERL